MKDVQKLPVGIENFEDIRTVSGKIFIMGFFWDFLRTVKTGISVPMQRVP